MEALFKTLLMVDVVNYVIISYTSVVNRRAKRITIYFQQRSVKYT